mmetsp:Transcript_4484/g.9955  ORF Transcript_4484/g.9955 Transcript_4484/m.9955 type:complete len:294 (+) Transcript_4484:937-1818(+)
MDIPGDGTRAAGFEQQPRHPEGCAERLEGFGGGRAVLCTRAGCILSNASEFKLWRARRGDSETFAGLPGQITEHVESAVDRGHAAVHGKVPRATQPVARRFEARRHHGRARQARRGLQPDGRERVRAGPGVRGRPGRAPEAAHVELGLGDGEDTGQAPTGNAVRPPVRDGGDERHTGGQGGYEARRRAARRRRAGRRNPQVRRGEDSRTRTVRDEQGRGEQVHEELYDERPGREQCVLAALPGADGDGRERNPRKAERCDASDAGVRRAELVKCRGDAPVAGAANIYGGRHHV